MVFDAAGHGCDEAPFSVEQSARYAWRAYVHGLTFNSGYVARLDDARVRGVCAQLEASVSRGELESESLYVVHPSALARFTEHAPARVVCSPLADAWLCASAAGPPGRRAARP